MIVRPMRQLIGRQRLHFLNFLCILKVEMVTSRKVQPEKNTGFRNAIARNSNIKLPCYMFAWYYDQIPWPFGPAEGGIAPI